MCILYLYTKTKNELCIPSFCTPKTDTHVKQTISVFYIALFLFLLLFKVNYPPISVVCVSALTERQFNHHQSRWDREYNREELALPDRLLKQEIFPYTVIPVPTSSTYAECQAIVAQSSLGANVLRASVLATTRRRCTWMVCVCVCMCESVSKCCDVLFRFDTFRYLGFVCSSSSTASYIDLVRLRCITYLT